MKFSTSAVVAALVASVSAKPIITNTEFTIEEGKAFTITWSDAVGPVKLEVASGDPSDLKRIQTITSSGSGGSFEWTPKDLPSGTYALVITDGSSDPTNYSQQFQYSGTGTLTSTTSGSNSTSTSSSSNSGASTTSTSGNSTTTTSSTSTRTSATSRTSTNGPQPTTNLNNSPKYQSPLAFVLVTVASLLYFN